jgi:hypothetical protein
MRPQLLFIVAFSAASGLSCAPEGRSTTIRAAASATSPADSTTAPPDFLLLVGKGGGFTGRWLGFSVGESGEVWKWTGPGQPSDSTLLGTLDRTDLDSIWTDALRSGLFERTTMNPGNLSARIELTGLSRRVTLTWTSGFGRDTPDLPEERFYGRLERRLADRLDDGLTP